MKYLSLLLCLCFLSQHVEASNSRIKQVSPEEMEKIKKDPSVETKEVILKKEEAENPNTRVIEETGNFFSGFTPNSGEEVLIVFAIVGVVLVIAWIVSFPVAVYKAIKDKKSHQEHMIALNYFNFSLDDSRGSLLGLKYGFYLGEYVGITSEVGQFAFKDEGSAHGQYWSVGPSMIFKMTEDLVFKLDLGAGSSFNSQFGLMSKADLSLNWIDRSGFTLGLGMGAMYLKVKELDDVTRANQDIGIGYSVNTGYVF